MKDEEPLDPQLQQAERIAYLIAGFLRQTLTPEEHDELDAWVEASPENMKLFEELTDEQKAGKALGEFQKIDTAAGLRRLHDRIHAQPRRLPKPRRSLRTLTIIAAAAVLIIAVAGILFFSRKPAARQPIAAGSPHPRISLSSDAGSTIWIDSAANGDLTVQGNVQVVKSASSISFYNNGQRGITQRVVNNTLATARGAQYGVVLPDGSQAWLNAASSISFPSSFVGRERKVALIGEAYFEVMQSARPFQLLVNSTLIEVTGTRFNVNAYGDESAVRISLIEGSLRIVQGDVATLLKAGEEADVDKGGVRVRAANLARATGWHEGRLVFSNTPLPVVARELSRWYDADIEYKGHSNLHVSITIDRGLPLERVMKVLEGTGNVHFHRAKGTIALE